PRVTLSSGGGPARPTPARHRSRLAGRAGPHGGNQMPAPRQHKPQDIEVALHQYDRLFLADRHLGLVQVEQQSTLVKNRCLGGVEIFGLTLSQKPTAETDHPPSEVVDRKEEPISKPRNDAAVLPLGEETAFEQHSLLDSELVHRGGEGARLGSPPQAVLTRLLEAYISTAQVVPRLLALGLFQQLSPEPVMRGCDRTVERLERIRTRPA